MSTTVFVSILSGNFTSSSRILSRSSGIPNATNMAADFSLLVANSVWE